MQLNRLPLFVLVASAIACQAGGERRGGDGDTGAPSGDAAMDGGDDPSDATMVDAGVPNDVGSVDPNPVDPFDPDAACGSSATPTERVPGSLLLVFDRSGSMDEPPGGGMTGPSKWMLAGNAIRNALGGVSDELSAGLMLFPAAGAADECNVTGPPEVPIAPLSTSRMMIDSALSSASPEGSVTPIFSALRAGWDHLDTLMTPGQRGVVLVTDGAENCDADNEAAIMAQAASELADNNYLTYVVGLTTSNSVLSNLAYNGGTRRNDTCLPDCTTALCNTPADCIGMAPCVGATNILGIPIPGFCSCMTDAQCPMGQTCMPPFFPIPGVTFPMCAGPANCCHYDATAGAFEAEFQAALEEIAERFLDSCVFEVPRGDGPFDPNFVNVGVTFTGEPREVLGRSDNATIDSWNYTTPENESIIIQGPICDRLLAEDATVEIAVGCATILI